MRVWVRKGVHTHHLSTWVADTDGSKVFKYLGLRCRPVFINVSKIPINIK